MCASPLAVTHCQAVTAFDMTVEAAGRPAHGSSFPQPGQNSSVMELEGAATKVGFKRVRDGSRSLRLSAAGMHKRH